MLMTPPSGGDTFTGHSGLSISSLAAAISVGPADVAVAIKRNWTAAANQQPTGLITTSSAVWDKLRRGYELNRFNNPHVNAVMSSPPVVTLFSSAQLPNSNAYVFNTNPSAYYVTGGVPTGPRTGNTWGFAAFSVSSGGNLSATRSAASYRLKLLVDAIDPVFLVKNQTSPFRFIVVSPTLGPQYVSLTGITPSNAGVGNYIKLDFTNVGGRAVREIWIEGTGGDLEIYGVSVRGNETVRPAPTGMRMTIVGDSITAGTVGGGGNQSDCFAIVLGECFGIADIRQSGVASQGVQAVGSGWNLPQRLSPSINTDAFVVDLPPSDVFVLAMGINDDTFSYASNLAAYTAVIGQIFAQYPTTPLIVMGCPSCANGPLELNTTCDQAIQAAVAAVNNPLCFFIPNASRLPAPPLLGVGNTTTPCTGTVTATGALSAATSCTLTAGFPGPTGLYNVTFDSGTVKPVTLTNNSTAVSWAGAVTAGTSILYSGQTQALVFTAPLVAAINATLTPAYNSTTGTYLITFSDGSVRQATLTNGQTAVNWTDPVTAGTTAIANCLTSYAGNADVYYNPASATHPNTAGHFFWGLDYADQMYAALKAL